MLQKVFGREPERKSNKKDNRPISNFKKVLQKK